MYVRYANNFLIGVVRPKPFVIQIQNEIDGFIKSDLHLQIKQNFMTNRNNKPIMFLDFLIKPLSIKTKTQMIPAQKEAILRYKKRAIAKMSSLNIRVTKSLNIAFLKALNETAALQTNKNEIFYKKDCNILIQ